MINESINVNMLGRFTAYYHGKTLKVDFSSSTKMVQLLALLFLNPNGISREKLIYDLYGNSELADSKNNLRVTISRLRKVLGASGLPEDGYITVKEGIYRFGGKTDICSDVSEFTSAVAAAGENEDPEERLRLRERACRMYLGEFLPEMAMEEWVMMEQVRLKDLYTDCLSKLCEGLKARREYGKLLEIVSTAAKIYPYDEWQAIQIDALMAMDRYDDAMDVYDKTVSMYFDDLGIPPSDNMLRRLRAMSDSIHKELNTVDDIMAGLEENNESSGAYYCSFPSFIDNFRMLRRLSERDGRSCFLVVCTVVGKDGKPVEDKKKLYIMGENIKNALARSLRRGDTYTKYSSSQFLLLLAGLKQEDASIVTARIDRNLSDISMGKKTYVRYKALPLHSFSMDGDPGWKI